MNSDMDKLERIARVIDTALRTPPTVAVDFDGVLNLYDGWVDEDHYAQPRPGLGEFLYGIEQRGFAVVIHTTRSVSGVWQWLKDQEVDGFVTDVSNEKPPAIAYIDDRAICFRGDFETTLQELGQFRAHWQDSSS